LSKAAASGQMQAPTAYSTVGTLDSFRRVSTETLHGIAGGDRAGIRMKACWPSVRCSSHTPDERVANEGGQRSIERRRSVKQMQKFSKSFSVRRSQAEMTNKQAEIFDARTPQDVTSVAKSQRRRKSTADK
jgi:hypothetical protein